MKINSLKKLGFYDKFCSQLCFVSIIFPNFDISQPFFPIGQGPFPKIAG